MKFKVDENLPVEIAELLQMAHYDAVTVADQGLSGEDDSKHKVSVRGSPGQECPDYRGHGECRHKTIDGTFLSRAIA